MGVLRFAVPVRCPRCRNLIQHQGAGAPIEEGQPTGHVLHCGECGHTFLLTFHVAEMAALPAVRTDEPPAVDLHILVALLRGPMPVKAFSTEEKKALQAALMAGTVIMRGKVSMPHGALELEAETFELSDLGRELLRRVTS